MTVTWLSKLRVESTQLKNQPNYDTLKQPSSGMLSPHIICMYWNFNLKYIDSIVYSSKVLDKL